MPDYITIEVGPDGVGPYYSEIKKQVIAHFLTRTEGNVLAAAGLMGVEEPNLTRTIAKLNLKHMVATMRQDHRSQRTQGGVQHNEMDFNSDADHLPIPVGADRGGGGQVRGPERPD